MDSMDRLVELLLLRLFMEKEESLCNEVFSREEHLRDPIKEENIRTIRAIKKAQIERLKDLKIL